MVTHGLGADSWFMMNWGPKYHSTITPSTSPAANTYSFGWNAIVLSLRRCDRVVGDGGAAAFEPFFRFFPPPRGRTPTRSKETCLAFTHAMHLESWLTTTPAPGPGCMRPLYREAVLCHDFTSHQKRLASPVLTSPPRCWYFAEHVRLQTAV
jgi:hypothetical protein